MFYSCARKPIKKEVYWKDQGDVLINSFYRRIDK